MLALFSTAALGLSIGSTSLSTPSTLSRTPAVTMVREQPEA